MQLTDGRNDYLGRECDGCKHCCGRHRAVVVGIGASGSARGIAMKNAEFALVLAFNVRRSVRSRDAPNIDSIIFPGPRVGDGICALGISRTAVVLEIVNAPPAHIGVLDAAKVDPRLAVLVAEERSESEMRLTEIGDPGAVVCARPLAPRRGFDRKCGRAER